MRRYHRPRVCFVHTMRGGWMLSTVARPQWGRALAGSGRPAPSVDGRGQAVVSVRAPCVSPERYAAATASAIERALG